MTDRSTIDVDAIVDRQTLGWFNYSIVFWSFLIMLLDGWDIVAAAVSVPSLIKEWGVKPAELGPMLSANNLGVLFGAPLFGWLGDRFGRRPAIVLSAIMFGVFTLGGGMAGSLDALWLMRLCGGVGIAGVITNTIALNAEMAPTRLRASLIIIMFLGNTTGGALPGLFGSALIGSYGWRSLFYIGGVVPILLGLVLWFVIPESIKFLALSDRRRARTAALARIMSPGIVLGADARFTTATARRDAGLVTSGNVLVSIGRSLSGLFAGRYAVITLLIWLLFAINLMVFYFVNTWTPAVLGPVVVKAGGAADTAFKALFAFQIAGTFGGLVLTGFLDRLGLRPVFLLILCAIPATAVIGWSASNGLLIPAAAVAGFCLLSIQFGLNASVGIIYPTEIRSNGVGWAFGIGRFGAIIGPLLGAELLRRHYPIEQLFVFVALPMVVSAIACLLLIRLRDTARPDAAAKAAALSH